MTSRWEMMGGDLRPPGCLRRYVGPVAAVSLIGLGAPLTAWADAALEEIVVTAQKREQRAQDVGIAITAFTGDQLREMGISGSSEIAEQTPSMKIYSFSPSLTVFNIRGVSQNDFADHYEAPVAVFVDEAYVSAQGAVDTQMLDIERVEVLRGPQGTLFGRNATGGIIQYVSRKPTDTLDGHLDLTYGSFSEKRFEGALGGPLTDRLTGRLAIGGDYYNGWVKDTNGPPLNDSNSYSYRGQLQYKATDSLNVLVSLHGVENRDTTAGFKNRALFVNSDGLGEWVPSNVNYYGTCPGCDPRGFKDSADPWTVSHYPDYPGRFNRSLVGTTAKVTWDTSAFTLTSISDYYSLSKLYSSDSSASPYPVASYIATQDLQQLSQEIRLSGQSGALRWVTGVYYLYIDAKQNDGSVLFGTYPDETHYRVKTYSPAVFGQVEYALSPAVTGILGVRYTEDRKEMDYVRTGEGIFAGTDVFNPAVDPDARKTFRNYSAKAELDWKPIDEVLLYGEINRGHKGGSFAAPLFPPVIPAAIPHDQEVLYDYEGGVKSTLAGGRVTLNADVFYYDYRNYQAFSFANLVQTITNVDALVKGAELELHAKPVESFEMALGVSALDGTAKNVKLPSGRITDRDMPMTPSYGINGLARYTLGLARGNLAFQVDGNYSSHFYWFVLNEPQSYEPGYFVGNARISYAPKDGPWEVGVGVRNFTERKYRIYTNDISSLGYELDQYAPPRWYTVSVSYRLK